MEEKVTHIENHFYENPFRGKTTFFQPVLRSNIKNSTALKVT